MTFADREPLRHRYPHGPYSMLGPVEVSGAEPGDVIEVSITALRTIARPADKGPRRGRA
jgi:acetamidase/formamidase